MAKYSKKAQKSVKDAMHERKRGKLRSGRSGKKVTSRKQAILSDYQKPEKKGLRFQLQNAQGPPQKKPEDPLRKEQPLSVRGAARK